MSIRLIDSAGRNVTTIEGATPIAKGTRYVIGDKTWIVQDGELASEDGGDFSQRVKLSTEKGAIPAQRLDE